LLPNYFPPDDGHRIQDILITMIEGIIYTLWIEGLFVVLYYMYRLHKEIKKDEEEYRNRFLDDMM